MSDLSARLFAGVSTSGYLVQSEDPKPMSTPRLFTWIIKGWCSEGKSTICLNSWDTEKSSFNGVAATSMAFCEVIIHSQR